MWIGPSPEIIVPLPDAEIHPMRIPGIEDRWRLAIRLPAERREIEAQENGDSVVVASIGGRPIGALRRRWLRARFLVGDFDSKSRKRKRNNDRGATAEPREWLDCRERRDDCEMERLACALVVSRRSGGEPALSWCFAFSWVSYATLVVVVMVEAVLSSIERSPRNALAARTSR